MAERRQATRREPIEVELADGRVFYARPLPWMDANDFGNTILQEQAQSANEAVRLYVEDNIPQLAVSLELKVKDWQSLLNVAYPEVTKEEWSKPKAPDRWEAADLVLAALDVNGLEHLKSLVDPNYQTPTNPGGLGITESGTSQMNGQKTTSILDSSEQELTEIQSSQ